MSYQTDKKQSSNTIHIGKFQYSKFKGNLASCVTEDILISFFSYCGQITNLKLAGDPNYPSRFAFIEFASDEQASQACQLSGYDLFGKIIKVSLSKAPISQPYNPTRFQQVNPFSMFVPFISSQELCARTIYVTGIDSKLNEKLIIEFFSYCGQITNYKLCGDINQQTRFAFIEFSTVEGALYAMSLDSKTLGNFKIRVSPSKTPIQQSSPTYTQFTHFQKDLLIKTVHVGNINLLATEDDLRNFFKGCGKIVKVSIAGEKKDELKCKFAFIEFEDEKDASKAITLSGCTFAGKEIKVSPSRSPILQGQKVIPKIQNNFHNPYLYFPYIPQPFFYYNFIPQQNVGEKRTRTTEQEKESKKLKI